MSGSTEKVDPKAQCNYSDPEDDAALLEQYNAQQKCRLDALDSVVDDSLHASASPHGRPQWDAFCKIVIQVVQTNQHHKVDPSVPLLGDQSLSTTLANKLVTDQSNFEHWFPDQKPNQEQRDEFFAALREIIKEQRQGNKVTM